MADRATKGIFAARGTAKRRLMACLLFALPAFSMLPMVPAAYADGGDETDDEPTEDGSGSRSADEQGGPLEKVQPDRAILTIEGLLLRRKDLPNVPFTKLGDAPGAATSFIPFTASELNSDEFAAGIRGTLQAEVFGQPIELSGFFMDPISQNAAKFGMDIGNLNTDAVYQGLPQNDLGGSGAPEAASDDIAGLAVSHDTRLFGAEANILRPFGIPGLLVGARGIYFGEDFSATTIDAVAATNARDHVTIRADNRLLGLQAGIQHMFNLGDNLRVGGSVKAGLFNNFVDTRSTFLSEANRGLRSRDRQVDGDVFAQGVEINPRVEWKLADGILLTASGQFLWLNNVSNAVTHYESAGDSDDTNLRAKNETYFYGGSLGLTFELENVLPSENGLTPVISESSRTATLTEVEERVAELEQSTARTGNDKLTVEVSGSINRMLMAWDDGIEQDVYVVDNTAARSRLEFRGGAKIARGWSAGYFLSVGLDDTAANDVSQLSDNGEQQIEVRHSAWWLRSNAYGTVHLGLTSPATDDIILKDVGGIMPGAANIATIGGNLFVRRSDVPEQPANNSLVISGAFTTALDEFAAGASVDTLRRNVVRYDAPRISGQWGNINTAFAWGENDFVDVAVEHSLNLNDFRWRFGAGWLNDRDAGGELFANGTPERRDRKEWKGSASLLHMPSGLFGTVAYVHRTFGGASDSQQTTFGENTIGLVGPVRNRPATDYLYTASGIRRAFSTLGDTSIYGEFAQVDDALTGLREADLREVTDSRLQMVGAAISQNIDAAAMDVYIGVRHFRFDTEGVICPTTCNSSTAFFSPVPLTDITIGYAGSRIKF